MSVQMRGRRRTLIDFYRDAAVIAANTVVLLIFFNATLLTAFWLKAIRVEDAVSAEYGGEAARRVHRRADPSEVEPLLRETLGRKLAYEPFTGFTERPFAGRFVNVCEQGFRRSAVPGSWPPDPEHLNIFMFGGSTTFGYGVADGETIPSGVQAALERRLGRSVRTYNFGRGSYYSTQERILYEQLLLSGVVPDVAVFVDGLNDFFFDADEPQFTQQLRTLFDQSGSGSGPLDSLPMARLAQNVANRWNTWRNPTVVDPEDSALFPIWSGDPPMIEGVIRRYLNNKKMIEALSTAFGVTAVFVWQPVPTYDFDFHDYPLPAGGFGRHASSKFGYERMATRLEDPALGANFLWCAELHRHLEPPLYIDSLHYSTVMSKVVAERIAELMIERRLLGPRGRAEPDGRGSDK